MNARQPKTAKQKAYEPKVGDLVFVRWADAFGCPAGWEFEDEASRAISVVSTAGWLMADDGDNLLVVPHIGLAGVEGRAQYAGHINVPRRQILSLAGIPTFSWDRASGGQASAKARKQSAGAMPLASLNRVKPARQSVQRASKSSRS